MSPKQLKVNQIHDPSAGSREGKRRKFRDGILKALVADLTGALDDNLDAIIQAASQNFVFKANIASLSPEKVEEMKKEAEAMMNADANTLAEGKAREMLDEMPPNAPLIEVVSH